MEIKRKTSKPFSANITIGLNSGYADDKTDKSTFVKCLQTYQEQLIKEKGIYLSASVSDCNIIMSGQNEPHLKLQFINYPKFPLEGQVLKREIEKLARHLMSEFKQNRIVIEFSDETVMLEASDEIDPRITFKTSK